MGNRELGTIVVALLTAACNGALAQGYPTRPIALVVPYAPGGATDLLSRTVGQKMGESMGQTIMVDNRSGAGGIIGSNYVAHAAPDGYTIQVGTDASHAIVKFTDKSLPYDPVKDFTPLTVAVEMAIVLAVHTSVPANNVKEFVEYVKKNPGKISYGTPGVGGSHHFAAELFKKMTGTDMLHVPYKGTGQSIQDLVGGQIPVVFASLAAAAPQARGGKIKLLGMIEAKRQASAPEIPTIGESVPGYVMPGAWNGFFGPAGLPAPITKRLNAELLKALHAPDAHAKIEAAGMTVTGLSPEDSAALVKSSIEMYGKIAAAIGIKPE